MNPIKKTPFIYALIFLSLFGISSCEKYFGDINTNPNAVTDVTPQVLLPSIQVQLAYTLGGEFSRYSSMFMQQTLGLLGRCGAFNVYQLGPVFLNNAWNTNTYAGTLADLNILIDKTTEAGYNQYTGVVKVLLAYNWMVATDIWGDMPYQEAFKGTEILQPKFDSQEFIYSEIFRLLDEADGLLIESSGGLLVGSEDLVFGGDIEKWKKFSKAVRAKASLHLSEVDGNKYYADALAAVAEAMTSNDDNAYLPFGVQPTEASPWYNFNRDRTGDVEVGNKIKELVEFDPRGALYTPTYTNYNNHPFLKPDHKWAFATYTEMKFIQAEALLITGGDEQAIHDAYMEAIYSDFEELDLDDEGYISTLDPGVGNVTLENIMTQKYIALHKEPEVFNDWRRKGIPTLVPTTGQFIPVRLPYAETEILKNENTPDVDLFTPVWWDQ